MTHRARIGSLLAIVLFATGCTTVSAGEPRPTSPPSETSTEETSTTEESEERPREIRLDDVDSCALIPQADYPDYYMDEPGTPGENATYQSPECTWTGTEVGAFGITLVVTDGIDMWLDGSRINVDAERTDPIDEFPTVKIVSKNDENACYVGVDVADGQHLLATVIVDNNDLSRVPERCEYAHQLAESAMSTLVES